MAGKTEVSKPHFSFRSERNTFTQNELDAIEDATSGTPCPECVCGDWLALGKNRVGGVILRCNDCDAVTTSLPAAMLKP